MGWTTYRDKPSKGAKAELDSTLTFTNSNGSSLRVLASAIKNLSVYYAAVEETKSDGSVSVFAAVYPVRLGREFSYKDMTEFAGPYYLGIIYLTPSRSRGIYLLVRSETATGTRR